MFPYPPESAALDEAIPVPEGRAHEDTRREHQPRDAVLPHDILTTTGASDNPAGGNEPAGESPGDWWGISENKTTSIVAGFLVLFFILLISVMFSVSPLIGGTVQNATVSKTVVPGQPGSDTAQQALPEATLTKTPSVTPVIITSTPAPQPAQQVTPASYVTIEAVPTPTIAKLTDITEDMPKPSTRDYVTIYSMTNEPAVSNFPYVSFDLVNPPLVLEYTIIPVNITDKKWLYYKIKSQAYEVDSSIERPYEDAWFTVVVRDMETGKIVLEDGWGRTYPNSLELTRKIALYKYGKYRFEFSGNYVFVTMDMKVKKEGNIP
jgi:hypothetical protein